MRNQLLAEAVRVRSVLEQTRELGIKGRLNDFPHEVCDHSAKIMAFHLLNVGFGPSVLINRKRRGSGRDVRHVWIEHRGFIVDLTADQFDWGPRQCVIVAQDSPWHDLNWVREPDSERMIDEPYVQTFYERCRGGYTEIYLTILEHLKEKRSE